MDLSILTWLKHSKPMHSMPLSMPLSWTESLDHLEHVMGPCWCFWAGPHQSWKPNLKRECTVRPRSFVHSRTSTTGNGDPHPMNIDSRTRIIRMTPRRQLFFDKSFFSSLENNGREIISPTHTHTHTKCGKQEVLLI